MLKKLPVKEKVYEAFTAIADERVRMKDDHAEVDSSNDDKTYTVRWKGNVYTSDDPATYWQQYPGYPVIAVWILQGLLQADRHVIMHTSDIPWHDLNDSNKRNYAAALKEALQDNEYEEEILAEGEKVNEQIKDLDVEIRRSLKEKK